MQVCDGVLTTCKNIPKCGLAASCDQKTGKCVCKKGYSGNGFQVLLQSPPASLSPACSSLLPPQCTDKETGLPAAPPSNDVTPTPPPPSPTP